MDLREFFGPQESFSFHTQIDNYRGTMFKGRKIKVVVSVDMKQSLRIVREL